MALTLTKTFQRRSLALGLLLVLVFGVYISTAHATVSLLSDSFTGTTIDTNKWSEADPAGLGGTAGFVQQNGTLSVEGAAAWGQYYIVTAATYDRAGGMAMDLDVTCPASTSVIGGFGYGDPGVTTGVSDAYTAYLSNNELFLSRQAGGGGAENVTTGFTCTSNVVFHVKMTVGTTTGASLYINGSGSPAATVTGGTFNNKGWFLEGFAATTVFDNFALTADNATAPAAPGKLIAAAGNTSALLSWTLLSDGGSAITDYVVEYKASASPTWLPFADGTSSSTTATVTGLTNGTAYDFRVSATNTVGTGAVSGTSIATPNPFVLTDDFTGTTIDTSKWTEIDSAGGGSGGTAGNVQQNGSLTVTGTSSFGTNGIKTVSTHDRSQGDVSIEFNVTRSACGASGFAVTAGYGDFNFTDAGTSSYILLSNSTLWQLYYFDNGSNLSGSGGAASPQLVSGFTSCTNGVPFKLKLEALQAGGAKVYVNGSSTASATITTGTFTNKTFWLGAHSSAGTSNLDSVRILAPALPALAPTGLSATPGSTQASLTWTNGGDNGATVTDYVVEYKLSSAASWSTFADGTSASTAATVTGLTNGLSYDFRVSAVNANGTSGVSSSASATPFSVTPVAPTATSLVISGALTVGERLVGSYTFADGNGNSEATSTYRWLSSATLGGVYTAISGATNRTYVLTSSELSKYIKFEVTPVSTVAPTTGSVALSAASGPIGAAVPYLNQIVSTGQSLSVGYAGSPAISTTQPYSNVMLTGGGGGIGTGTSLTALIESTVETMGSAMANTITEGSPENGYQIAVTNHGVSSLPYSQLKKGTVPYTTGMSQVTKVKDAATVAGKTSRVVATTTIHGETDNLNGVSGAAYLAYLEEWQSDLETDIKAITGQTGTIPMFTDQMSSYFSSFANTPTSEIPIAQLAAAEDNPGKIFLVTPKYFFNYSDRHHLTSASYAWLGEYYGKVIKKVVVDGESWRPLSPDRVTRKANIIYATFHVPSGSLVFDTTIEQAKTNYGFEYFDNTSSATISSVEILDADTVKVTLSGTPTGANQRLRYAYTGTAGVDAGSHSAGAAGGNLRDTDTYPSLYGNTLYNWAVHFDDAIVEDTTAPVADSITASIVSTTQETITWSTNEPATSRVEYGTSLSYGSFTTLDTTLTEAHSVTLTGLTPGTLYYYRVLSNDEVGNAGVSSGQTFTSDQIVVVAPTVTASAASLITATVATLQGNITALGGENATSRGFNYGLTDSYGQTTSTSGSFGTGAFSVEISGLTCATTYHFQAFAINSAATGTSTPDVSFTTDACPAAPSTTSPGSGARIAVVPVFPTAVQGQGIDFVINKGAKTTTTPTLSFTFNADPRIVTGYAASIDPNFTGAGIHPYEPSVSFVLPNVSGTYTVYVKFFSTTGHSSAQVSHSITYSGSGITAAFTRLLTIGMKGQDVLLLQKFLNTHGFGIAASGAGSPGQETDYYGSLTAKAVSRFQMAYKKEILDPLGLIKGTGIFGPATAKVVQAILGGR